MTTITTNHVRACLVAMMCAGLIGAVRADNPNSAQETKPVRDLGGLPQARPGNQQNDPQKRRKPGAFLRAEQAASLTASTRPAVFNKATSLIGMGVQDPNGERLGSIREIVIDLDQEKVSYVVLTIGGRLGITDKLLAVPLAALTRSADQTHLVLQADKKSIAQAEGIGKDWPSVRNPSFGAIPFWQKSGQKNQYPAQQRREKQDQ